MEDFIRGVLINEEFLDSRIYWEPLISPGYALPISSWKAYKILCRDILQRQCYPLAPDTLPLSLRDFIYMSKNTYKHHTSTVSKGCTLHSESIIGINSTLGKNSFVKKSVIGSNCTIGTNVNILNSFVISDVTIQDDCIIEDSIIFSNCIIEKGKKLEKCILLPNVACTNSHSNSFMELDNNYGTVVIKKLEELFIDDENCEADYDDASSTTSDSSAWSSPSSRESPQPMIQDDNELFLCEVIDSMLRGFQDELKCENLILEINSSRYAYNVNIRQVSYNVVKAILKLPLHHLSKFEADTDNKIPPTEYFKTLKKILDYSKPIIENYIKTENAQDDCLLAIQDVAFTNEDLIKPYVIHLIKYLYDRDILMEEKIIEWYERDFRDDEDVQNFNYNDNLSQDEKRRIAATIRKEITPFVNWLKEAEESSDSE